MASKKRKSKARKPAKKRTGTRTKPPEAKAKTIGSPRAKAQKKAKPSSRKRPSARKPKKASPKKRTRVKAKKKTSTRSKIAAQNKRLKAQLEKLRKEQAKLRGKSKKSRARQKAEKEEKLIIKTRVKRALKTEQLPTGTPAQVETSREQNWQRMRPRFRSLFNFAKKSKQLPKSGRARRKIDNYRNIGEERVEQVNRILSPETVQDILYFIDQTARKIKGNYSLWYANLIFSAFGDRLVGSKPRILNMPNDKDARFFQTEGYDNTGIWNTYDGMYDRLEKMLEDYANSPRTVVFLHHVRIMNFDRKRRT